VEEVMVLDREVAQPVAEVDQLRQRVVHPAQEDRLIVNGHQVADAAVRAPHLGKELAGVVDLRRHLDAERILVAENLENRSVDTIGVVDRRRVAIRAMRIWGACSRWPRETCAPCPERGTDPPRSPRLRAGPRGPGRARCSGQSSGCPPWSD
jgi:hypothetical protein